MCDKRTESDQTTARSDASDQALHRLLILVCPNTWGHYGNIALNSSVYVDYDQSSDLYLLQKNDPYVIHESGSPDQPTH